jgi:hypothetical protein
MTRVNGHDNAIFAPVESERVAITTPPHGGEKCYAVMM